jgi:hypothetical protein
MLIENKMLEAHIERIKRRGAITCKATNDAPSHGQTSYDGHAPNAKTTIDGWTSSSAYDGDATWSWVQNAPPE